MAALAVTAILTGLEVGAQVERFEAQKAAEAATEAAIRQRMTEERLAASQKAVARDRQVRSLVGHQVAIEAASGFELSSGTFKAITIDDFNKFSEERSNDKLELDIKENQLQQDVVQTQLQGKAQMFGDVLSTAAAIIPETGLFTNISKSVVPTTPKLATPVDQDEFNDATATAKEKRSSGDGLFDDVGN